MKFYKKSNSFRESYIDTLGKLYDYSTIRYANNRVSKVIDTDKEYTYAGFKAQCDSLSKQLTQFGIGASDKVAILSQNMPEWTVAFFATVPFGRIAIPILPESSANEVTNILNHSESKVLFVSKKLLPNVSRECIDKLTLVIDIETFEFIKQDNDKFTCDGKVAMPMPDDRKRKRSGPEPQEPHILRRILLPRAAEKRKRPLALDSADVTHTGIDIGSTLPYVCRRLRLLHVQAAGTGTAAESHPGSEADHDALGPAHH